MEFFFFFKAWTILVMENIFPDQRSEMQSVFFHPLCVLERKKALLSQNTTIWIGFGFCFFYLHNYSIDICMMFWLPTDYGSGVNKQKQLPKNCTPQNAENCFNENL